jgi:hypothetical protein
VRWISFPAITLGTRSIQKRRTPAGHPINVSLIMHPVMTRSDVAVAAVPLRKTLMP